MKQKISITKSLSIVAIFGVALALSSCQSTAQRTYESGDHEKVIQSSAAKSDNFGQMPLTDLRPVCMSLVKVREYTKAFDCIETMENRVAKGERLSNIMVDYTQYTLSEIYTAKTEALLSLGQNEMAWRTAQKAISFMDAYNADNPSAAERGSIVEPYGVAAMAAASVGKTDDARRFLAVVENLFTGWGGAVHLHHLKVALLAQGFMAIGDYTLALKWIETEGYLDSNIYQVGTFLLKLSGVGLVGDAMMEGFTGISFEDHRRFERDLIHAHVLFKINDHKRSKEKLDALLSSGNLKNFSELHYIARTDRARIALREGNDEAAVVHLKEAIIVIEKQRSSINTENYKLGFAGSKQAIYADIIGALLRLGRIDEAFEYTERAKARALVDLLASKKKFGVGLDGAETRALLLQLAILEQESRRFTASTKGDATRSVDDVLEKVRAVSSELESLVSVSTSSAAEISSLLRPDEALIEYYYHGKNAYAFVIRKAGIKAFTISAIGLRDDVADFRASIDYVQSDDWKKPAKALYGRLIAPVVRSLQGVRHLTIVPHGVLHYLPFNVLGDSRAMIERFTMRLLPSASTLRYLDKKKSPTADLLVFGNPDLGNPALDLPGAEQEANDIAGLWKDSRVLFRKSATESVAKTSTGTFRFLHFASHGEFNPDEPMKSRLLLSPDGENDGDLTVSEIYDIKLNAEMVTLSACETGLGDVKNGDDVVGLIRGFLYAGARSVVASLWKVPDESTRYLMTAFYQNLKGMDQRSALQRAQLSTRAKFRHPAYWAAFQMTGGT